MFKKALLIISCCLITLLLISGCKNPLKKETAPAATTINISDTTISVQKLVTPLITTKDPIKILDLSHQNDLYYIALRSEDNNSATLTAFKEEQNILSLVKEFGKDGTETLEAKMILDVSVGQSGTVYFTRNGFHAYKDGADNVSLAKKTSATKIALLPDESGAYLYGNDNFDLATIVERSIEKTDSSFLKNRAAPFRGGLSHVVINGDTIYGGGRLAPNDLNIIASFDKSGKLLKQYGKPSKIAKDSIISLISFTVLDNYICVIDGFTFKLWKEDGTYIGSVNNSEIIGDELNAYKVTQIDGNTFALLAYQRNKETKDIDSAIFKISI